MSTGSPALRMLPPGFTRALCPENPANAGDSSRSGSAGADGRVVRGRARLALVDLPARVFECRALRLRQLIFVDSRKCLAGRGGTAQIEECHREIITYRAQRGIEAQRRAIGCDGAGP